MASIRPTAFANSCPHRNAHRMLYGPAPVGVSDVRGLRAAFPIGLALVALTLTGLAWPPGLANALAHITRLLGP